MTPRDTAVIVGLGELGGFFAHGLLRQGLGVVPVLRDGNVKAVAAEVPEPQTVLVAVAETDLNPVLASVPPPWRGRVALLQNELLPHDWEHHGLSPTVCVVWFEKKRGKAVTELLPTVVHGPGAALYAAALKSLGITVEVAPTRATLVDHLVAKNVFILTTNVAGLITGGTVAQLVSDHSALMNDVMNDVLELQGALTSGPIDRAFTETIFDRAVRADPNHGCAGRSAPARLSRALAHADAAGLSVPALRRIAEQTHG